MNLLQLGPPRSQTTTSYSVVATADDAPYQSVWWLTQDTRAPATFRFIPDLSVHLVYDLSGLIEFEPFLIHTGPAFVDLALPAGAALVGVQFAVWQALWLRHVPDETLATYAISFDADWAMLLYFALLDARNTGAHDGNALHEVAQFKHWIDGSIRNRGQTNLFDLTQLDGQPLQLAYSERQGRRIYHELTGMSPIQFKRVLRLQNALNQLQTDGQLAWDGYFDQAHFTRECRALTGLTPTTIRKHYLSTRSAPH